MLLILSHQNFLNSIPNLRLDVLINDVLIKKIVCIHLFLLMSPSADMFSCVMPTIGSILPHLWRCLFKTGDFPKLFSFPLIFSKLGWF